MNTRNLAAGKLNDRVAFQTATQSLDSSGQPQVTFTTYKTVWAECLPASASERMRNEKPESAYDWKIRIRYATWINQQMRAVFDSRNLEIKAILFDQHKRWMEVLCREVD